MSLCYRNILYYIYTVIHLILFSPVPSTTAGTFLWLKASSLSDDASVCHNLAIPAAALKKPKKTLICPDRSEYNGG